MQATREGNKLIAAFMNIDPFVMDAIDVNGDSYLNYERSWNALMPVVEKIESYNYTSQFYFMNDKQYFSFATAEMDEEGRIICEEQGTIKIEVIYLAVVKFIKWYNFNQSKHGN